MSTARERAAAHIDEVFAEGHAIVLMTGGWRDGRDATVTSLDVAEPYALSPDTRKLLTDMGHNLGVPQPANHMAAIIVGAPSLGGKPVGNNRFYGANDPRRNTGLAAGY